MRRAEQGSTFPSLDEQLKAAGATEQLRQCGIPFAEKQAQPMGATARPRRQKRKTPMAPGVREEVWKGMKKMTVREDKNLGQLAETVLEWSVLQLRAVGSIDYTARSLRGFLR
jgi:hypothetical protein